MKILILSFILFSCASNKEVIIEAQNLPVKTLAEKKLKVKQILSTHKELEAEQLKKLEKLLIGSLEKLEELRAQESKLIQQIMNKTLVDKGSYEDLVTLRKALKKVYLAKNENFDSMTAAVKRVVGIKPENLSLAEDIGGMDFMRD